MSIRVMNRNSRVFVAGVSTLAGRALQSYLRKVGWCVLQSDVEPDFANAEAAYNIFEKIRPDYVWAVAGKSGGIDANQNYPAELMRNNLLAAAHIFEAARRVNVKKLLYLASSCIYPRDCLQPMRAQDIRSGPLEPTSEAYATAKLAALKLCEAYRRQYGVSFITAIVADAFGPETEFDPKNSHVIPALIYKMHRAKIERQKEMSVWGSGKPVRDFIYSEDLADACLCVMENWDDQEPINLSASNPVSIADLAQLIREVVGFSGRLIFDLSKPDGAPSKILDAGTLFKLGWRPKVSFPDALKKTYEAFLADQPLL